jgi:aldehyde dehydrogenase (NAD+)
MTIPFKTYSGKEATDTSEARILEILDKQRRHRQAMKDSSARERRAWLKALEKAVIKNREAICEAAYADFRKAKAEMEITEVYPSLIDIRDILKNLDEWLAPQPVEQPITYLTSSSEIIYEPKGNSLVITPWNYPFYLSISPVAMAIAAGNTVLLKPSEFTPHVSKVIEQLLADVFPEEMVAVVQGGVEVSKFLLEQKFDKIHFTGSPQVGKIVMKAASEHLTDVTLELGGKSPAIIDASANLRDSAQKIAWGKLVNAGQTCVAPDYVLVDQKVELEFLQLLREEVEKLYGQAPVDSPDYCRIIHMRNFDRIKGLMEAAVDNGAEMVFGGETNAEDLYFAPTVLRNVKPEMAIMQEEIFGPVLPVISYEAKQEGVDLISSMEKPLALYVFSQKRKEADFWLQKTSAGGSCVNDVLIHISQPNLPFGGVNNSGIGKSHGKWGFISFSNERAVVRQHSRFGIPKLLYPPYTKLRDTIIDLTIKWF